MGTAQPEDERDTASGHGVSADRGRRLGHKDLHGHKGLFPLDESSANSCRSYVGRSDRSDESDQFQQLLVATLADKTDRDPDPLRAQFLQRADAQLRRRDHHLYVPVLFAAVPAEVVAVEVIQKSVGQRSKDEGDAGQDQGPAKERRPERRPADARAADGAAQDDQGRPADRRMSADAAAVPAADRVLHGGDGFARGAAGVIHVAAGSVGG